MQIASAIQNLSSKAAYGLCAALVGVLSAIVAVSLASGPVFVGISFAVFLAGLVPIAYLHRVYWRGDSFGCANVVTLARWALISVLVALFVAVAVPGASWFVLVIALGALALDGVDGKLARHFGEVSTFGARFDMEIDALLILVLSGLIWWVERTGAWVLLAGGMRYGFVLAGMLWPALRKPLPYRRRRQFVCVVQILSLLICIAPIVPAALAPWIAAVGIACLIASFAIDVLWLLREAALGEAPAIA